MIPNSDIDTPCAACQAMEKARELPRTLMGGTTAMRAASGRYLPREPAETAQAYLDRLNRSVLFNAYRQAVRTLTGKVFSKPLVLDTPSPDIRTWCQDIDLAGRDLHNFARDVLEDAFYGVSYILVDHPPRPQGLSLAQERQSGARPYFVHVPSASLIGFRTDRQNGAERLVQARILESAQIPDGTYGDKTVSQVRVLELAPGEDGLERCVYTVWRQSPDDPGLWAVMPELSGVMSLNFIPLVPVYTNRTGFMQGTPPLIDLADLNAAHWRSSSDQETILHFTRVPLLFGKCLGPDAARLEIGPNRMIRCEAPEAELKYVEHSGSSIAAGRQALMDLEDRMAALALEPLVPRTGSQTATARAIDAAQAHCTLQAWALGLEDALKLALRYLGAWAGLPPKACGQARLTTDYGLSLDPTELTQLTQAYQAGLLSRQTVWSEMIRRGLLDDQFNPEEEEEKIRGAAPDPAGGNDSPQTPPASAVFAARKAAP